MKKEKGNFGMFANKALVGFLTLVFITFGAPIASADTPSVKIGNPDLVDPTNADIVLGTETIHTTGINGSNVELQELARALRYDPALIYEYVRNRIEIEPTFGLTKGAFGAHIDEYGTAFDQAHLLVELLKIANTNSPSTISASYQYGVISLNGTQFDDWFGITDAKAACQLLARGGFPGTVNGSSGAATDCTTISGTVTSVTMSHVWVEVTVDANTYDLDPSYKPHTFFTGINLGTAMSYSATGFNADDGTTGTQNGVNYVTGINPTGIESTLQTYGTNLLSHIENNMADDATMEDVIGGQDIDQALVDDLANEAPPYSLPSSTTWTDIPDQFRTTLKVEWYHAAIDTPASELMYGDEVYGRSIQIVPDINFSVWDGGGSGSYKTSLKVDGSPKEDFTKTHSLINAEKYFVELTLDSPYAADGGTYMDTFTLKRPDLVGSVIIVMGFGHVSQTTMSKFGVELPKDIDFIPASPGGEGEGGPALDIPGGSAQDSTNQKMAANWLAQFSKMAELQGLIGDATIQHHFSIGVVFNQVRLKQTAEDQFDMYVADQMTRMDIESGVAVTHDTASQTDENAIVQSLLASASTLEGSVFEQMMDTPDTASTAVRFAWGENNISSGLKFFLFEPGDEVSNLSALMDVDVGSDCVGYCPNTDPGHPYPEAPIKTNAVNEIEDYLENGYSVLAANDAFLGPGWHMGFLETFTTPQGPAFVRDASMQRGAAFIAFKEDANGNLIDVAHIVTALNESYKGGGAAEDPNHFDEYNPAEAADILKDRFEDRSSALGVDLSSGSAGYSSGSVISVGSGGFPYELSAEFNYNPGVRFDEIKTANFYGVTHNWDVELSLSGSGMEAMGERSVKNGVASIVAIYAAQNFAAGGPTTKEKLVILPFINHWWGQKLTYNTASIQGGGNGAQFFRQIDGTWNGPDGSPVTLTMQGTDRVAKRLKENNAGNNGQIGDSSSINRHWDYTPITGFTMTLGDGSSQVFTMFDPAQVGSNPQAQFKLTRWQLPSGFGVDVTYQNFSVGVPLSPNTITKVVFEVTNDFGRKLTFDMPNNLSSAEADFITISDEHGRTVTVDVIDAQNPGFGFKITNIDGTQSKVETDATSHAACGSTSGQRAYRGSRPVKMVYAPTDLNNPSLCYIYGKTNQVKKARDAQSVLDIVNAAPSPRPAYEFFIANGHRGERMDPLGGEFTVYYDDDGKPVEFIDELGRVVSAEYDGIGRVTRRVFPEGDESLFTYDANSNTLSFTQVPKPGSGLANRVASATWDMTWNKPLSVTDFKGATTTFIIGTTGGNKGQFIQATLPTVPGPTGANVTPVWGFAYTADGQLDSVIDPLLKVTKNTYDAEGNLTKLILDNGGLNLSAHFEYDPLGNQISAIDPRGSAGGSTFKTTSEYNIMRRAFRVTGPEGEVTTNFFDAAGRVVISEQTLGNSIVSTSMSYTATGQEKTVWSPDGAATTNFYDALDRVLEFHDAEGRVTRFTYDGSGQLLEEIRAFGTALSQVYSTFTYSDNGQQLSIADANGNTSTFHYDGFDRLVELRYPNPVTPGSSNPLDNELFSYDANGNVLSKTTRADDVITNTYDALNRILTKTPGTDPVVNYFYSARSQQTEIRFTDGSQHVKHTFDAVGRITNTETKLPGNVIKDLDYTYDAASNRKSVRPANSRTYNYSYDQSSRMTLVEDGSRDLAKYTYDQIGRRTSLVLSYRSSSANTVTYNYEPDSALDSLVHAFDNSNNDVDYSFDYTLANQVSFRTVNNDTFQFAPVAKEETYTANGLNQYTEIIKDTVLIGLTYDANGNLTGDGTWIYTYDVENRLINATDGVTDVDYVYDPLGRRVKKSGVGVTARLYLSDGTEEVLEMTTSGSIQARYVYGPGVDEPIMTWQTSSTSLGNMRFYRADPQGSIIALTDRDGETEDTYTYDAYGNPDDPSGQPIRYTGRRWDAETGLYYYRARMYSPALGRFLQTDPIGYGDGPNIYGYTANDPLNFRDPSGKTSCGSIKDLKCQTALKAQNEAIEVFENGLAVLGSVKTAIRNKGNGTNSKVDDNLIKDFEKGFGVEANEENVNTVLGNVGFALGAMKRTDGAFLFNGIEPGVSRSKVGRVLRAWPLNIDLVTSGPLSIFDRFFERNSATHNRPQIIGHETLHLLLRVTDVLLQSGEGAYGRGGVRDLRKEDKTKGIQNADNYIIYLWKQKK